MISKNYLSWGLVVLISGSLSARAQPRSNKIHATRIETRVPGAPQSELLASQAWKTQSVAVDRDTCIMAVMHHARKIDQDLKQTELFLKATINQAPRGVILEWTEKPHLNRAGAKTKIEEALRAVFLAKNEVSDLAGSNGDHYAVATLAAQNRCEEGLNLRKLESTLGVVQQRVQDLFDNGYVEMKSSNFEGFSETFLTTIFAAQQEVEILGTTVTTKPNRRVFGLFGSSNPHEKAKNKITALEKQLRKNYPSAFGEAKPVAGSDQEKQMLAVNADIVRFLETNEIGYSDAANFWKSGLVRDVNSNTAPQRSAAYVDDLIVDKISR